MIRAGVIGYGYWAPNVVRNFVSCDALEVVAICDRRPERLEAARRAHDRVRMTTDPSEILRDPTIDAVAIVTPVATHFELALEALRSGKHVWIEKPIAATSEETRRLIDEAAARRRVLLVDHTFVYTPAVQRLKELHGAGEIGQLRSYDSVRTNLGLFRPDVNVLGDLAVHDLSIVDYAFGARVEAVSATGAAHVGGMPEDSAYLTCFLSEGAILHAHVDWLSPDKVRRSVVGGDRRMVVYDDVEPIEKLRIHDAGVDVRPCERGGPPEVAYRRGAVWAPELPRAEALGVAAAHFADCIEHDVRPLTDGELGLRVVRVLEAATRSMKARGRPVEMTASN